jgi:hypothetical protein
MRPNGPGATFHVWSPLSRYVTWCRTARVVAIMAMTVALGTTVSAAPVAVPAAGAGTGATVIIDGAHPGPEFQGIGAISGGGGNSRLLIDYPPGERTQILDYLFLPLVLAALRGRAADAEAGDRWRRFLLGRFGTLCRAREEPAGLRGRPS